MGLLLTLAFLFFIGSIIGWCIEVVFRKFFSSSNPERKWINPGFCTGPYLPLYGCGLACLFLIASFCNFEFIKNKLAEKILIFIIMAVSMTVLEYISGVLSLKIVKVRLWDYSDEFGNIQGIICPKFSIIWALLGAVYYFGIHPYIMDALNWLSNNLAFSFVIGMFYGVFIIDVVHSTNIIAKLKQYADENDVIVRYESLKANIRKSHEKAKEKYHFFKPLRTSRPLREFLEEHKHSLEKQAHIHRKKDKSNKNQ